MSTGVVLALTGAALAVVVPGISSALGISYVGQASAGAMVENPRNFGRYLVLLALPGTQGIYGFVIGFLLLQKVGLIAGQVASLSTDTGWALLLAGVPIAVAGLSAIWQGKVCTSGVGLTTHRPEDSGKALIMAVFVEFYAVLGFLTSIFMVFGVPV
ncbi:MAG: V-type ATP synthase subunit K [Calditrichaeota bacterium]|nr:MAG: V-type ATP synthase subunit K [Calditrichota bacterium]